MDIRGLNNPSKQEVLSFIKFHKLCMFGGVESKVRQEFFDATVRHCFPSSLNMLFTIGGMTRLLESFLGGIFSVDYCEGGVLASSAVVLCFCSLWYDWFCG